LGRFRRGVADIDRLDNFPSNPEGRGGARKQMDIGGLVVAAQILGIPGAFAGPWEDVMAATAATICRSCEC
jgi:hypothetical protein